MKNYKRVDGDYTIQMINTTDVLTLDSTTVEVTGNLEVLGNVTYINTEQLNVNDPFLALNDNEANSFSSNAGLLVHKTASDYAGIRYNNDTSQWQISTSTSSTGLTGTWNNISAAGSDTHIQFNNSGSFGGEAAFVYDYDANQVGLDGSIRLTDQSSAPANVAGATVLYANTVGSGGSGVYFVDGSTSDELVSKSKAIVYGIIF
jgi:hypothetical protein